MARQAPLRRETTNPQFMWDRHSHDYLASYVPKTHADPQPYFTVATVLAYLSETNPRIPVTTELTLLGPLAGAFFAKQSCIKKYAPFILEWFDGAASLLGRIRGWRLGRYGVKKATILDIGCGSGNYYRLFLKAGLGHLLDYTGIDLSRKNIANCRQFFPGADLRVGNILDLKIPAKSFDLVLVNSVFEHLSSPMLPRAIGESLRVAKDTAVFNFFCLSNSPRHVVRKINRYYWNCLSLKKVIKTMNVDPVSVTAIDRYPPGPHGTRIKLIDRYGRPLSRMTLIVIKSKLP